MLRPALLGFVAMLAIAVGASFPSSPFKLEMPGVWFFGVPSTGGASTWGVYFVLAAVYGGLLLLMRVWWGMTRLYCPLSRGAHQSDGVGVRPVVAPHAGDRAAVQPRRLLVRRPGRDGQPPHEPVLYGPFQLGNNSFTAPVDSLWGNAPAPYGPLFLQLDGFFARITFHNDLATIVLLRLLALAGVVLMAVCVPRLARLYHRDGAELFTLMILNPVTLLHLIGGAHNDALMLGLLLAGITAAKEKRPIVGHRAVRPGHRHQGARPPSGSSTSDGPGSGPMHRPVTGSARWSPPDSSVRACSSSSPMSAASGGGGCPSSRPRERCARGPRPPTFWHSSSPASPISSTSGWASAAC